MSFVSCSESDSQDDPEPLDDEESNANITVGHLHRNIQKTPINIGVSRPI